ncbi:unnamed protein product, partial [Ectocarpus sp. 12 AP-2014]
GACVVCADWRCYFTETSILRRLQDIMRSWGGSPTAVEETTLVSYREAIVDNRTNTRKGGVHPKHTRTISVLTSNTRVYLAWGRSTCRAKPHHSTPSTLVPRPYCGHSI